MGDITPSRIAPLGDAPERGQENPGRKTPGKPKAAHEPAPDIPVVESETEEIHQVDELA